MTKGHLSFLIGLPRSGKTSFANEYVSDISAFLDDGRKRVCISGDSFRTAISGQIYNSLTEGLVFASMDIATRAFLNDGYDVIIDETSSNIETIKRYLRLDINAEAIFIDATEEECIQRAISGGQDYLIQPIKRIAKQYEHLRSNWSEILPRLKAEIMERSSYDKVV